MDSVIKISVRNLVEYVLKSGSINSGFASMKTALDGSKGHRVVQKLRATENEQYLTEVPVMISASGSGVKLEIGGRIDGVIVNGAEYTAEYTIEEIKTTERQLSLIDEDYNELHWAQAMCYAYIYSNEMDIKSVKVQLTYYHRGTKDLKSFVREFEYPQLQDYFLSIVSRYIKWAEMTYSWNQEKTHAIEQVKFPFDTYRQGQREFAVGVYKTITQGKRLFAKAPTGIGKTIAALFPAVKSVGEGHVSKIFYLTAKTSTRQLAEEAFENLRKHGLKFRTVTITAKEKTCPQDKVSCKPEDCPYADGYYDRIDRAIEDIMQLQNYNKESIQRYSQKHMVCPFEFSLDISLFCDGIICDYNYVFDPRVYLKRFFTDVREDYVFLIDEAHNLIDRGREMYSSEILKSKFLALKNDVRSYIKNSQASENKKELKDLKKSLDSINSFFIGLRKMLEDEQNDFKVMKESYDEIGVYLSTFLMVAEKFLAHNIGYFFMEKLLELYFEAMNFQKTSEEFDEKYVTYVERSNHDIRLKLFCLDPSRLLREAMQRGKSVILFSATFSPLDYFRSILGGEEDDYKLSIKSPFNSDNLCLLAADNINTTYRVREQSFKNVSDYIKLIYDIKKGNYFVFFPSYKYMMGVYEVFTQSHPEVDTIMQRGDMSEKDREEFLLRFSQSGDQNVIGFAVLGGAFGEGIDLVGDKLIGAIIVGVGLPQICLERNIIKDYFAELNDMGFEYSYMYPGMNKVLQAAGRVIRTERDKGVVFLIDQRFARYDYRALMPPEWENIHWIKNSDKIRKELNEFWRIV